MAKTFEFVTAEGLRLPVATRSLGARAEGVRVTLHADARFVSMDTILEADDRTERLTLRELAGGVGRGKVEDE